MFDLNRQIDLWKATFAAKGNCAQDELEELESHLREQIAALAAAGLSEADAFRESVARLGDPELIGCEFAKNERGLLWDSVALRAGNTLVVLVGLAAIVIGLAVWLQRGDGLLGAHQGSIVFAYVVPFLLASLGTYSIVRAAIVKSADTQFRDRLAGHCRFLYGAIALLCAAGAILGGFWARQHLGRFWGWDPKEIGALSVVVCAVVLCFFTSRSKPTSLHLGQASLVMSMVTCVAWFGPAIYLEAVGTTFVAVLVLALIVQLSILGISVFLPKRRFAEN